MGRLGKFMKIWHQLPVIAGLKRGAIRALIAVFVAVFAHLNVSVVYAQENPDRIIASTGRIIGDEGRARLVMDFDKEPAYELHYLNDPARIIIDLPDVDFQFEPSAFAPRGLFTDVRFGAMVAGRSRIVLTASKPTRVEAIEVVKDQSSNVFRFVLDAERTTDEIFKNLLANQNWDNGTSLTTASVPSAGSEGTKKSADFVVVIDPGHGGIDAGAQGAKTGVEEKIITLDFSKQLAEIINAMPGLKAVLTRDSDVFLSLSERVALARQQGANMLISVHADTLRQKDIRGATIYTLSDKASDRMAQALAERENKSDQIAGLPVIQSQPEVADILIDLTRRETQVFSITLAERVLEAFKGNVTVINNPHRHAGFQVLRAHDVPSVLLELGFLSNEEDEKLLTDEKWRKSVADLIAKAVGEYRAQAYASGQ